MVRNPVHSWSQTLESHFYRVRLADQDCRLHIAQWGESDNPRVVVCAHGLTRNARDFDVLAKSLAADYHVLCVDFPGRGKSDWLNDKRNYTIEHYAECISQWLAALHCETIHWIGTSMGGLVGMWLAGESDQAFTSIVLNDVGPEVPTDALQRIAAYLEGDYRFKDLDDVELHLRFIHAPFGALTDAEWRHLAQHSSRETGEGELMFHYDPGIARAFEDAGEQSVDLWSCWRRIDLPVLLLRGETSDVLTPETAQRMLEENRCCSMHEIAAVGHAPALMASDQIHTIQVWLKNRRLK